MATVGDAPIVLLVVVVMLVWVSHPDHRRLVAAPGTPDPGDLLCPFQCRAADTYGRRRPRAYGSAGLGLAGRGSRDLPS
jgi:hypothetical protein